MAKNTKSEAKKKTEVKESFLNTISSRNQNIIATIIILIPLLYYFLPFALNDVMPTGTDVSSTIGQTHLWRAWMEKTGETVLWNPNIFGGEPIYPRITPNLIHIDSLIRFLNKIFTWIFWYLLAGGLGIYYLLKYKKIPWYLAVIVSVVFVLLPDWQAQIGEGHNSKLRALMIVPWMILSFTYFYEKKSWLSAGLFALVFSWFVRTHHFQIIFYGILILFFLYIYPTIMLIVKKEFKEVGNLALKFGIALLLTFMTAAQPLFTTNEYAEYSIRGGNPVQLGDDAKSAKAASGVDFNYATQWSFSPNELFDFFIPHYSGGISSEIYDGKEFPQLKGRQIPGYWGEKPFSGNYANMGMILFLFAILGIIYNRKNKFVIALAVFSFFSILLSFGRHFPELYKLFFYYVPYFAKFRAPAMTLNATFITILILSGFGLKAMVQSVTEKDFKVVAIVFGAGLAVIAIVYLTYGSFAYATSQEASQYDANTLNLLKGIRKEFLLTDLSRLLIIMLLTTGIVIAYVYRKIKLEIFVITILLLSAFEIFGVSNRAHSIIQLSNHDKLEQNMFKKTEITNVLSNDQSQMRAIALGRDFTSNHYAYFYPLISGYSAIKLQNIQDVIAHNLFSANSPDKLNWNIVNMLSGKFVIAPGQLNYPFLKLIAQDKQKNHVVYENRNALPKAWFVNDVKNMSSAEDIILFMNTNEFNPDSIALVKNSELESNYSGIGEVEVIDYNPNSINISTTSDSDQFLVLAEIYYPEGWEAKIDDSDAKIYQVNHILRGLEVPAGNHEITLEFRPQTYYASLTFLWIGNLVILSLIFIPLLLERFKKKEA